MAAVEGRRDEVRGVTEVGGVEGLWALPPCCPGLLVAVHGTLPASE